MDQNSYSNDTLHAKTHSTQAEAPKRKKYAKKKADSKPTKQSQDANDGPLPEISQDLNSDLIHYTYKLEFELSNAKKKLKYQRKKFKRLIQSLAKYFDSKGVASRMVDEYIKSISHQLGQESDSETENNKNLHQSKHQPAEDLNHSANNLNNTTHSNNHKASANSKSQKNPSNLIKINLTDVNTGSTNVSTNGNVHNTAAANVEVATVMNINPKDVNKDDKKNPTFVINHEPKKRRTKKVKPNPDTPESSRIKHEEKELPTAQIVKIDDMNKKYSTKKYEDLAEYAQKSSNEILKEFMYQNGMQDLLKQVTTGVEGADLFKLNAMLQLNNPPFVPSNNAINEAEILNGYAKMFQDWMPINPSLIQTDKANRDMLQFYHAFANK